MKANPKAIGAFVVGGIALLVGGIVTFGSFQFFAARLPVVMYFDGDLSGLDVGAPLVVKGVRIGTVTDVALHYNATIRTFRIPVHAVIEPDRFILEGASDVGRNLPLLISEGLRAQLATQSLLTGKLLVSLQVLPETPVRLIAHPGDKNEIPTVPSEMSQLQSSVEGVLNKIQALPLDQLLEDVRGLIQTADSSIKQLQMRNFAATGEAALQVMNDMRGLIAQLSKRVDELAPAGELVLKDADKLVLDLRATVADARPMIANARKTMEKADRLLTTANDVIEPGSPAYRELVAMLREFSNTARSIRAMADSLERNPDSILFGKTSGGRPR